MNTAIAIFVKTPSLSPVKTRLAAGIGTDEAIDFYKLSLTAVEQTVQSAPVQAYWALAEEEGAKDPLWVNFPRIYTEMGDLGKRQHHIYETLLETHDYALLIGADTPQLTTNIIEQAIEALKTHDFVMGPARDGGYYLFGGRLSTPVDVWSDIAWSTENTRQELEDALPSKPAYLIMRTDVDTIEDVPLMLKEMPENATSTQQAIKDWAKDI